MLPAKAQRAVRRQGPNLELPTQSCTCIELKKTHFALRAAPAALSNSAALCSTWRASAAWDRLPPRSRVRNAFSVAIARAPFKNEGAFGPACVTILDGSPVVIKYLNYASTARREYAAQPKAVQNTTVTVLQHVSKIRC